MGKDIIDKALVSKIKLSCFVGDRLRAQIKALNHLHLESLQNPILPSKSYKNWI